MTPPDDPYSKLDAEIRRMTEATRQSGLVDASNRALVAGALAGIPPHVRDMVEGQGACVGLLDAARDAVRSLAIPAAMPDTMWRLLKEQPPYAGYLETLKEATTAHSRFALPPTLKLLAEARSPSLAAMETLRQTAEAARLSPLQESLRLIAKAQAPQHEALLRSFADNNAYTRHLDAVRSAVVLAITPEMQNTIILAARGLPDWLKPAAPSDMLLPSWHLTAGIGAAGVAGPALVRDVLRSLHRDRPETVAFEVAVGIAESFDDADGGVEQTADLLQRFTAALIALGASTRDWVAKQGIVNLLALVVALGAFYDCHLARLDADEQTALARVAASTEPTPAQWEITRHLQEIEHALGEQAREHAAERDQRVVVQAAPLRLAPEAKSTVIRIVYPDDRVRVQEVTDGWARVEVFEYRSEAAVTGWINRRVLRRPPT